MSLDPKSLRLFVSAIRHGSIADAAHEEHLAPSALSRRISELEAALGTALVTRTNRGIAPTLAGQALLDLAHRVLNDLEDIQAQMREFSSGIKGYVRVFGNLSAMTQFLPGDLSAFLARHPKIQVHLEQKISSDIARAVRDNEADVGVLVRDVSMPDLVCLPYREDRLVLIVPKKHRLARSKSVRPCQTWEFDYVGLPPGSQINNQLARAARHDGAAWRCRFHVPSYDVLGLMVEAGLGIGMLPLRLARAASAGMNVHVVDMDAPWAARKLDICIRDHDALSPSARLLVGAMRARRETPLSTVEPDRHTDAVTA